MSNIDPYAATNSLWGTVGNLNALDDRKRNISRQEAADTQALITLQRQEARAAAEAEATERKDRIGMLSQLTEGLLYVPAAERNAVYNQTVRPVLQSMGFDEGLLGQIDAADKSDVNLRSLASSLGAELAGAQTYNTRQGVIERDPYSGTYTTGYELAPEQPNAPTGYRVRPDGGIELIPGYAEGQATLAAGRRAPPRASGGGRSSGEGRVAAPRASGGASSRPAAYSPSSIRWD